MQYTRGKAGPVSRMSIEVATADIIEAGANSRASGGGVATKAGGRLQAIEFNVQGRHLEACRPALAPGGTIDCDVRWTGSTAVTITKVHGATPGTGATTTALPAHRRRRAGLNAQIDALFGTR